MLAADDRLDATALAEVEARLGPARPGQQPWSRGRRRCCGASPSDRRCGRRNCAASFGRDTQPFKVDVRKLKNLGLTYSLPVGYRLSPRGRAVLDHLEG